MKTNRHTAVVGDKVVLIPYRQEHVQKYHEWMSDPELLELTASEELTLEEEYEMQRKWQEDDDKLTFIILAQEDGPEEESKGSANTRDPKQSSLTPGQISKMSMIGDVNLFFKGAGDDGDQIEVEAEIMIAEKSYRKKGFASEALKLMFAYASSPSIKGPSLPIHPSMLFVRVGDSNVGSIKLFESLGFEVVKRIEVFEEVEMRLRKSDNDNWLEHWSGGRGLFVLGYP